jgi:polysaccharide pyruvyl transferase CsaB
MARFLISGYYGYGNLGDEALARIIVAQLRTRHHDAQIDVLSADPEGTAHELRVDATPRMDLGLVKKSIERADFVLSGGGGLLQNATSLKSLLYYVGIIRTAIHAEKPTFVFAQSVGPLDFWGKQTVRECCRGLTAASVRDERSRVLLASLVNNVPIERTGDPVFLYEPPETPVDLAPYGLGDASEPLVVFCVRKTANWNDAVTVLSSAADRLAREHGARVAFVPFAGAADAEAATVIIRKCRTAPVLVELDDLDSVAAAIARARLVVGVRLHSLILAARFAVPFLALPYDPKVSGLTEELEYPLPPLWAPGGRIAQRDLDTLVDRAWNEGDALRAHLRDHAERQRAAAGLNFEMLDRYVRA